MGKLRSSQISKCIIYALHVSATAENIPTVNGIHDMRIKNSFRGGSRGKGGKIKYARR